MSAPSSSAAPESPDINDKGQNSRYSSNGKPAEGVVAVPGEAGSTAGDSSSREWFSPSTALPSDADVSHDFMYKLIILGDSAVGKSQMLKRWSANEFDLESTATISVEFTERYKSLTRLYYRGSHGAVILYDITARETFKSVVEWVAELRDSIQGGDCQLLIVGNKSDLERLREVSTEEALMLAKDNSAHFLETSALNGDNCQRALQVILQDIHKSETPKRLANSHRPSEVGKGLKVVLGENVDEKKKANNDGNCAC